MTKAKKKHLLRIQEAFGGSLDYCKRNYRVNAEGVIVRTYYDAIRAHKQDVKVLSEVNDYSLYLLLRELRKYYK